MTTPTVRRTHDGLVRRAAYGVLVAAVRGRRERGGPWGEAVLGEFHHTHGRWEAVRWAAGGLRAVWQERRGRADSRPRYVRITTRIVGVLVVGLLAGLAGHRWVARIEAVPSGGMEPAMQVGDRYLLDLVSFRVTGVRHGDVIRFAQPNDPGSEPPVHHVTERVIGLPGDTIECRDGRVLRNGAVLDEPYLPADPESARTDCRPTTVPPGSYYVLGDHRDVSVDSRQNGPVPADRVVGRLLLRTWPVTR